MRAILGKACIRVYSANEKAYFPDFDNAVLKTGRLIAYDNLSIINEGTNYRVLGVEKWYGEETCETVQNRSQFMLIENVDASSSVLLADMHSSAEVHKNARECLWKQHSNTRFDGKMYQSSIGALTVDTVHEMEFVVDRNVTWLLDTNRSNNSTSALKGQITLNGKSSQATLEFRSIGVREENYYSYRDLGAMANLTVSTSEQTRKHTVKIQDFFSGVWLDMNDSDTDGLRNSWETYFGLDQNDERDAEAHNDGDFLSNLLEYSIGSDPANSYDIGDRFHRILRIDEQLVNDSQHGLAGSIKLGVKTREQPIDFPFPGWQKLILRLPSDAFWVQATFPKDCKFDVIDPTVAICEAPLNGSLGNRPEIEFASNLLSSITVTIEIDLPFRPVNPSLQLTFENSQITRQ